MDLFFRQFFIRFLCGGQLSIKLNACKQIHTIAGCRIPADCVILRFFASSFAASFIAPVDGVPALLRWMIKEAETNDDFLVNFNYLAASSTLEKLDGAACAIYAVRK